MATQLERATRSANLVRDAYSDLNRLLKPLRYVLDESQNQPPEGGSDGTIDEKTWCVFSDLVKSADSFQLALSRLNDIFQEVKS